ncbi:MAG: AMP-binding protein, partial [Nitratireductor sp.]|nr:AMP-binding protein [Nitratireductor sp.]
MSNTLYDALFAPHLGSAQPYLVKPDGGVLTYGDFLKMAARYAHAVAAAGVGPGDRIAVQIAKSPEALALYVASVQAGAIFLPLNTAYMPAEVEYFVGNAEPKLVVCDPSGREALAPITENAGAVLETLAADGSGTLSARSEGQPETFDTVARGPDDLAAFLYTSGTTGRSKGAMLSHRNLLSNTEVLADLWQFSEADVLLHALPIFHTHGLFVATNIALLTGGAMIFLPGYDQDAVLQGLPRATAMMGVPTFYTRLLDDPRFTRESAAHMRLFVSGSAPLLAETHTAF